MDKGYVENSISLSLKLTCDDNRLVWAVHMRGELWEASLVILLAVSLNRNGCSTPNLNEEASLLVNHDTCYCPIGSPLHWTNSTDGPLIMVLSPHDGCLGCLPSHIPTGDVNGDGTNGNDSPPTLVLG